MHYIWYTHTYIYNHIHIYMQQDPCRCFQALAQAIPEPVPGTWPPLEALGSPVSTTASAGDQDWLRMGISGWLQKFNVVTCDNSQIYASIHMTYCIYIYKHLHININIHMSIHINIYICTYTYVHIQVHMSRMMYTHIIWSLCSSKNGGWPPGYGTFDRQKHEKPVFDRACNTNRGQLDRVGQIMRDPCQSSPYQKQTFQCFQVESLERLRGWHTGKRLPGYLWC